MLHNDVREAAEQVNKFIPWAKDLNDARLGALVNMTFNMGIQSLLLFRNTLALIQAGEYDQAADEMLKSKWAKQVGIRATRLAEQMRKGEWE